MAKQHVDRWVIKLAEMQRNMNGRLVADEVLHLQLEEEMESLRAAMTVEEWASVEKPLRPVLRGDLSLIAHNSKGQLIGYEDLDEEDY